MFVEFVKIRLPLVPLTTLGPPSETEVNLRTPAVLEIKDEDDDELDDNLSLHHSSSCSAWNYVRNSQSREDDKLDSASTMVLDSKDRMEVDTIVSTRMAEEGHVKYIRTLDSKASVRVPIRNELRV
jgi:hypothetical protein